MPHTVAVWDLSATARFSPISGELEGPFPLGFDLYGLAGAGLISTENETAPITCTDSGICMSPSPQTHPTAILGAGLRLRWTSALTSRIKARTTRYIETLEGSGLRPRSPVLLQVGVTALL